MRFDLLLQALFELQSCGESIEQELEHRRKAVHVISKKTAEYLHEEKIKNIFFIDTSARTAWVPIKYFWDTHFDPKMRPGMYFLNPDGFLDFWGDQDIRSIQKRFSQIFHIPFSQKHEPLVLFDTCAHTGGTLTPIIRLLKRLKFSDVRVITAQDPDSGSNIKSVLRLDQFRTDMRCSIFGRDKSVRKDHDIVCKRGRCEGSLREDLKRVMQELS